SRRVARPLPTLLAADAPRTRYRGAARQTTQENHEENGEVSMTATLDLATLMGETDRDTTKDADSYAISVTRTYATDIDDLWDAFTTPERAKRFLGVLTGDLREGGVATLTMGDEGEFVVTMA